MIATETKGRHCTMAHPKQTIANNDSNHTNDSIVRGKRAPHHHGQPAGKTFVYNDSNRTNDNTVRGKRQTEAASTPRRCDNNTDNTRHRYNNGNNGAKTPWSTQSNQFR
jgi:hypothetical protein